MHPGVTEHEQAATFSVAKANGEAPVAAYLAAMPGWKSPASTRSSAVRSQPAQGGQVELALRRNRGPGLVPRLPCARRSPAMPPSQAGAEPAQSRQVARSLVRRAGSQNLNETQCDKLVRQRNRDATERRWSQVLDWRSSSDGRATTTMKKATTTGKTRKNGQEGKARPSLSADRCENQGAARLAGRHARSDPNSHQAGRPRGCRGVEVERGPGVVARRNNLHR